MRLVSGSPTEIAREHGVSEGCAGRVAALRAAGLDVTAAVLALAGPGSPVEGLLSDPRLEADGAQLTPAALRSLARARGVPAEAGLAVIRSYGPHGPHGREGRAAIALAEEVVGLGPPGLAVSAPVPVVAATPVAAEAASPETLRREMLALAAGVEEGERLRALRTLLAARLPPAEKGGVLLFALRDESRRIRREALEALRRDGLPAEVADALADLLSDRPAGRARAIASLSAAAPGLAGLPLAATLLTAGPLLRDESYAGRERAGLLRLLGRLGRAAAREPRLLPDLLDLLLREAAAGPVEAAAALREGLRGLAATRPPGLAARLLAEADRLPSGLARTAVLLALAELDPRSPDRARYEALLLGPELTRHLEVGEGGVPFRSYLVRLGGRLLPALVARAGRERGERRAALIGLAGEVLRGSGVAPAGRRTAARALAALAEDGEPGTAVALLRTGLAADPGAPLPARRAVAAAALALLGQGAGEEFTEEVLAAMEGLGTEAVPALVSFAADDLLPRPLRRRAIERAGRIADAERRSARRRAGAAAVRRGALEARRFALARGFSLADAMMALAGRLAAHPASPAPLRRRILRDLARRLAGPHGPLGPDSVGAAEGFRDYVARGGPLSPRERDQAARGLLRLLEDAGAGGGDPGTEVATRRGGDLAEGPGAAVHVRAVPAALDALRTLAERPGGPVAPVARALLASWRRLAEGALVLAPGARIRVAETLAHLARRADRRLRAEATAAILAEWRRTREVPLVPILAGLLAEPPALPEAAAAAGAFVRELLGDAGDASSGEDERRAAVEAAARVLAAGAVARGDAVGLLPALVRVASLPGVVSTGPESGALAALQAARGVPRDVRDSLRRLVATRPGGNVSGSVEE